MIVVICLLIPFGWIFTSLSIAEYRYDTVESIPVRDVGLLLGTSQYTVGGGENLFYTTRIEGAKLLYEKKKIKHILISGDNSDKRYNEPESMKRTLIKAGIPEEDITLDYAGFRTLDSILRARDIFGLEEFTIISQGFHVDRALYLTHYHGIEAIGYGVADISLDRGLGVYIREIGARWGAIFDTLFDRKATILGEKVPLQIRNL